MAIKDFGTPSKLSGILRPPLILERLGSDDFNTFSGWETLYSEGASPTITAENSYLKVTFSQAGKILLGRKFTISANEMKHRAVYVKLRIQSYQSTFAVAVGFWRDENADANNIAIDTNETAGVWRIIRKVNGSAYFYASDVSVQTQTDYELILVVYKTYAALYIPDENGNYVALGKRWRRIVFTRDDLSHVVGQDATVGIFVGTNDSCEVWVDIVELYHAGGEGIKDPGIMAVWENGIRKPYRDQNGYYYVMVQLSATPTNNVVYGNGKLVIFRTSDLKDLSKYEYFMTIWDEHKVSGDIIVYNDTVVILYSDFSGGDGSAGVGRARIPLSDFLNRNLANLVDDGIIVSTSTIAGARDSKFFQDQDGRWYIVITGDGFYVADIENPQGTPTNIRAISGWREYPPYSEHPGIVGISNDGKLWGWASSSGGNNALKLGKLDLTSNMFTDVYDPWYTDPDYQASEAYDLVVDGNEVIGVYQVPLEDLPTESGWALFALSATAQVEPAFIITGYPSSIQASPGSTITINVTIANNGGDGTVEVRVRDHNNNVVASKQVAIAANSSQSISLTATAPSSPGTYTWKIEAYNVDSGVVDDSKSFTVEVSGGLGGVDLQLLMQMFMRWLPLIMIILMIVLIVSLIVAAIR